jgi:uncharacterized protein (TIRG00374 family)
MSADHHSPDGGRTPPAAVLVSRALRLTVAAALLWWAVRRVDWQDLGTTVVGAEWRWLAAAVALVVIDRALMAWRWLLLLRASEGDRTPRLGGVLRVFFVSTFAGTFLPGSIGGDAVRAVSLSRLGVTTASAVGSVAVDRLLGIVSVALMGVGGLAVAGRLVDTRLVLVALGAAVLTTGLTVMLLFAPGALSGLVDLTLSRFATLHRLAHKFLAAVRRYGDHREVLAVVLAASVVVQILRTLQAWCLGLSLGLSVVGIWYFAWIPVIVLIVLLPISINGLGTGNAAFVWFFGLTGVSPADAFALSVLFLALGAVGNLPGGLLLAFDPPADADRRRRTH